nr:uncharacterized protein LOC112783627 isoform X5 [Arachis hypogaea]
MEKSKMVEAGGNNNHSSSMETGFGNNFSDLTKSFSLALRSLLTSCSNQLITSLHENIEVGATLDAVEEVIEERDLDPLFSERSNIMDVAEDLSAAKKNEIQHLKEMVQLGEEKNQMLRSRLQLLREGRQVSSGAFQAVEKQFRSMNLSYGANISDK